MNPGTNSWRHFVEVDRGRRIHVEVRGQGPPVILLHGFTGSIESMSGIDVGTGRRRIAIDLVGHGDSDAPYERAAYRMERCVADLRKVLEFFAVRRADWIGYSMGARVALAFAVRHPERVRSALLIGARAGIADPAARAERIRQDERLADRVLSEGVEAFVDFWMGLPLFASQTRLGCATRARARRQRLRNRAHALAQSLRGMGAGAQPPLHAELSRIAAPVLLVVGAQDGKFRETAEDLAARIPRASIAVLPEAGHAAHLENPAAFQDSLRDFLARVEEAEPMGGTAGPIRSSHRMREATR